MDGQSSKKHKKHRKRKHMQDEQAEDVASSLTDSQHRNAAKKGIKLKIKFGGSGGSFEANSDIKSESHSVSSSMIWEDPEDMITDIKKEAADTSDEEKEWLDALEKGTLDDNGELKKERDPSLLTARQRALLHGDQGELLSLPTASHKAAPQLTLQQLQRKEQRAQRRRDLAQQKTEKDKKQTLDRLLKKQDSKTKGCSIKSSSSKRILTPSFRYTNNLEGSTISLPPGFQFPFHAQRREPPPKPQLCGIRGCRNPKKYSCSKTGVPLCSLECYKKNLAGQKRTG